MRDIPGKGLGFGVLRYQGDAQVQATLAALPVPRVTFNYLGQFDQSFADDALFDREQAGKSAHRAGQVDGLKQVFTAVAF